MDVILNPNTSYDYTREAVYDTYLNNCIEQEYRINIALSEASILNESGITIAKKSAKIKALYEAKLSESIKSRFLKTVEFIKNLFGRFMANISKILMDEKDYLQKYSNIINGKPGNPKLDVSYYGDYELGIKRITNTVIEQFDWNKYSNALKAQGDKEFLKLIMPNDFQYNDGVELSAQLKDYFIGGNKGQTKTTMDKMPLKDMYNFCWNFKNIENITKRDVDNLTNSAQRIEKAIDMNYKSKSDTPPKAEVDTTTKSDDTTKPTESEKEVEKVEDSAINIDWGLYHFLNEDGNDDKDEKKTGVDITMTTDVSQASGSTNGKEMTDDDVNKQAELASGDKEASNIITKYTTIIKAIITAKWTAAQQIAKDYMKILNAHVKSYVGKTDDPNKKNTQQATEYKRDDSNEDKFKNK